MLLFSSDLHLGHLGVLAWRPDFSSLEEMDEAILRNWNEAVSPRDTVIVTGDLFFRNRIPAEEYLSRMKGKKILVRGNHDASWLRQMAPAKKSRYFEGIYDLYGLKQDGLRLRFCHYPMISWEGSRRGSILICGHIHGRPDGYEYEMFRQIPMALNAGVDVNRFRPVPFSELLANNTAFYRRKYTPEEAEAMERAVKIFG